MSDIPSNILSRLMRREGGYNRVSVDSGGVTRGGIAETSGVPAATIRNLTPPQIDNIWNQRWNQGAARFSNPGAAETFMDVSANHGQPWAVRNLQAELNTYLPQARQLPVTGVFGQQTQQALATSDQGAVARDLLMDSRAHHVGLATENPVKYGPYLSGWMNRDDNLEKSPLVAEQVMKPQPLLVHGNPGGLGTVQPAPPAPVSPPPAQAGPPAPAQQPPLFAGPPNPSAMPAPAFTGSFVPQEPTLVKQQSILQTLKLADYATDHERACALTNTSPTEAQAEAGNYAKGTLTVRGLHIAIENPKGSTRSGTDKSGKSWHNTMVWSYGYIKHIKGNRANANAVDDDKLDVVLGPHPETGPIYVVDQVIDGKYDESKCLFGFDNEECARQGYLANYAPGWKGLGAITRMTDKQFHAWVDGGQTEPAAKELRKKAGVLVILGLA